MATTVRMSIRNGKSAIKEILHEPTDHEMKTINLILLCRILTSSMSEIHIQILTLKLWSMSHLRQKKSKYAYIEALDDDQVHFPPKYQHPRDCLRSVRPELYALTDNNTLPSMSNTRRTERYMDVMALNSIVEKIMQEDSVRVLSTPMTDLPKALQEIMLFNH